jgi:hypothetical protein
METDAYQNDAEGKRQPPASFQKLSPDIWLKASTARFARNSPHGTPNCGHEATKPLPAALALRPANTGLLLDFQSVKDETDGSGHRQNRHLADP